MGNTTYGDTSQCECPACGKIIHDLWDYSLVEDTEIECPHCESSLTVGLSYEVILTLPDKKL